MLEFPYHKYSRDRYAFSPHWNSINSVIVRYFPGPILFQNFRKSAGDEHYRLIHPFTFSLKRLVETFLAVFFSFEIFYYIKNRKDLLDVDGMKYWKSGLLDFRKLVKWIKLVTYLSNCPRSVCSEVRFTDFLHDAGHSPFLEECRNEVLSHPSVLEIFHLGIEKWKPSELIFYTVTVSFFSPASCSRRVCLY